MVMIQHGSLTTSGLTLFTHTHTHTVHGVVQSPALTHAAGNRDHPSQRMSQDLNQQRACRPPHPTKTNLKSLQRVYIVLSLIQCRSSAPTRPNCEESLFVDLLTGTDGNVESLLALYRCTSTD